MKNKILKSALFAFVAILMVAPQAMALEIYVDDYGTVKFYQGSVLGRDDSTGSYGSATSYKTNDSTQLRARTTVKQSAPIKTLNSSAQQRIEFKSDSDDSLRVELKGRTIGTKYNSTDSTSFTKKEELETQSLDFSFPTDAKSARSTKDRVDYFTDKYSQRTDIQSLDEKDREKAIEKRQEGYEKYLEKLQEERKERSEERVEIRSRSGEEEGENKRFEIQSRDVKAKLQGADFSYDTKTGEVVLTTPSGQEHFLQHLPDQAIDRMTENGFFIDEGQEVEIKTTEDGQVLYKASSKRNKRFLGLFNRQVDTEVVLDDLTGEIVETEVETDSAFVNFLNSLSF